MIVTDRKGREVHGLNAAWRVAMVLVWVPLFIVLIVCSIPLHVLTAAFNGHGFMDGSTYKVPPWACLVILAFWALVIL
jgi:RsiW-degrading membrane proteinase PrsW (M82 family)